MPALCTEVGSLVLTLSAWNTLCSSTLLALFPPPVFDRLQYANTEGKAWEVTSGRLRVDTQEAVSGSNISHLLLKRLWCYE